MAQGHGERLTALDASFLEMETPTQHMHVGGVFVFDPPPTGRLDFQRFVRLVRSRLHLVPRYRQRLAFTPLNLANPVWVDDPDFDLAYHVRHAALPGPGRMVQLEEYAARVLSRQLDRDRPLWELYVVEGLADGAFAIIGKNHHAMIDGIGGLDLITVILDLGRDRGTIPEPAPWVIEPAPSGYDLTASAVRSAVAWPARALGTTARLVRSPGRLAHRAAEVGQGITAFARASVTRPVPRTMLNSAPGVSRRLVTRRVDLDDVKRVKEAFGTTVNDVVLALVGDVMGRYLRLHDEPIRDLHLRVMVPVSVRTTEQAQAPGNRVTAVFVDVPVDEMDPVDRLQQCHAVMAGMKSSHSALGAEALLELTQFAPPTLHALGARLVVGTRLYNLLVTNVPGPQVPVYCLGARLQGAYPFVPLAATQTLAVGVTSVDGRMSFGFTADRSARPDVAVLGHMLEDALAELMRSADAERLRHDRSLRKANS